MLFSKHVNTPRNPFVYSAIPGVIFERKISAFRDAIQGCIRSLATHRSGNFAATTILPQDVLIPGCRSTCRAVRNERSIIFRLVLL